MFCSNASAFDEAAFQNILVEKDILREDLGSNVTIFELMQNYKIDIQHRLKMACKDNLSDWKNKLLWPVAAVFNHSKIPRLGFSPLSLLLFKASVPESEYDANDHWLNLNIRSLEMNALENLFDQMFERARSNLIAAIAHEDS